MHSSITTQSRCASSVALHSEPVYAINFCSALRLDESHLHGFALQHRGLDGWWAGQVIGCTVITIMDPPPGQAWGQQTMQEHIQCRKNYAHQCLCIIPPCNFFWQEHTTLALMLHTFWLNLQCNTKPLCTKLCKLFGIFCKICIAFADQYIEVKP